LSDKDILDAVIRLQWDPGLILPDVGIDGLGTFFAGYGDPVIAVEHKVDETDLVELNGVCVSFSLELVDALPSGADAGRTWQKGAGELVVSSHTPDNLNQRDRLLAEIGPITEFQALPDDLEREQGGRILAQEGERILEKCSLVCALESAIGSMSGGGDRVELGPFWRRGG